ncbi:MAG: YqjF family protein, partial [Planctomycetaceae bacterium]
MSSLAVTMDRLSPTRRPLGRAIGHHCWSDLLFVHWRVPAELLRPLVPRRLTIDTFDGDAWVGLVPFAMSSVRPWWSPPVPGLSAFLETNVRTYVHLDGRDPGVWFFSLDASNSLAVRIARRRWHLNYFRSDMTLLRSDERVEYTSRRRWPEPSGADSRIIAEIGRETHGARPVSSDSLEHFLVERYLLFAGSSDGRLLRAQVHHRPYPLRRARVVEIEESLLAATGIHPDGEPAHVLFS